MQYIGTTPLSVGMVQRDDDDAKYWNLEKNDTVESSITKSFLLTFNLIPFSQHAFLVVFPSAFFIFFQLFLFGFQFLCFCIIDSI